MKRYNKSSVLILFIMTLLFYFPGCGGKEKSANKTEILKVNKMTPSLVLEPGNYTADSDSSSVLWECGWIGGRTHNGDVYLKEGLVNIKNSGIVSGDFVVDMNTIQCFDLKNDGARNKLIRHLKSDDFFDAENYQETRLTITLSENIGGNNFLFIGNLTIKGITNPIQMRGEMHSTNSGYGADIKLVFDRSKYNVRYKSASFFSDLGDNIILDDVSLKAKIRLRKISS